MFVSPWEEHRGRDRRRVYQVDISKCRAVYQVFPGGSLRLSRTHARSPPWERSRACIESTTSFLYNKASRGRVRGCNHRCCCCCCCCSVYWHFDVDISSAAATIAANWERINVSLGCIEFELGFQWVFKGILIYYLKNQFYMKVDHEQIHL